MRYSKSFIDYDLYDRYWKHVPWVVFARVFMRMVEMGVLVPVTNTFIGTYVIDEENPATQALSKHP